MVDNVVYDKKQDEAQWGLIFRSTFNFPTDLVERLVQNFWRFLKFYVIINPLLFYWNNPKTTHQNGLKFSKISGRCSELLKYLNIILKKNSPKFF